MKLERTGIGNCSLAGSADGEADERRDVANRWPALAAQLAAFAIALCIMSVVVQALQSAISLVDVSTTIIARPEPGSAWERAPEPLEFDPNLPTADPAYPDGRMYVTDEAEWWLGIHPASGRRIVY